MTKQTLQSLDHSRIALPAGWLEVHPRAITTRLWQALSARVRALLDDWARADEIEQAIAHLRGLSDAQLSDLGIGRADIPRVVRFGKECR